MRKRTLLAGVVIGLVAKPIAKRAYRPFRDKVRLKMYNIAFDFIQNFDAGPS